MGRRKQPRCLKSVCLISIAKNMKKIWCADYLQNFHDQGRFLHIIGPLSCLTPDLIQELIKCLVEQKRMLAQYLPVLLEGSLTKLDLSVCRQAANKDHLIGVLGVRCQRLTNLNISGCDQVSARTLADLVQNLPCLVKLNVSKTKCNDQVMVKIGTCLVNLRDLDVRGCKVTDSGAMSLCVSFDPEKPKVPKLTKLDISYTAISLEGVVIILKNCLNLQVLEYPDSCDAIYLLSEKHTGTELSVLPQLRTLHMSDTMNSRHVTNPDLSLSRACEMCPNVTEVFSCHQGLTAEGILMLTVLSYLRALYITNMGRNITFEGSIVPVLQMQGSHLEILTLVSINNIDISTIGNCCPNLKEFNCIIDESEPVSLKLDSHPEFTSSMVIPFRCMEILKLDVYAEEGTVPREVLEIMLSNASKIKSLTLGQIDAFDNALFTEVMEKGNFVTLESLILRRCNSISLDPIYDLCEEVNSLSLLHLLYCEEITRIDGEQLLALVEEENFDVEFQWS